MLESNSILKEQANNFQFSLILIKCISFICIKSINFYETFKTNLEKAKHCYANIFSSLSTNY